MARSESAAVKMTMACDEAACLIAVGMVEMDTGRGRHEYISFIFLVGIPDPQ